jgi:WD40 repeat protein
MDTTDAP